jgi:hypothetical protein
VQVTRPLARTFSIEERAGEQQDAADEAGASHGASLLILVFYGRNHAAPEHWNAFAQDTP